MNYWGSHAQQGAPADAAATMVHAMLTRSPTRLPQAVIPNQATAIRVAEAIRASQQEGSRSCKAVLSRGLREIH